MGKQTAVAMTAEDEDQFLAFLRQSADIQLFVSFAPTTDELQVSGFLPGQWQFLIWNKAFAWTPEYDQVTGDKSGERRVGITFVIPAQLQQSNTVGRISVVTRALRTGVSTGQNTSLLGMGSLTT